MTPAPVEILLVDDDEEEMVILRDLVGEIDTMEITLSYASTYEEGMELIETGSHDLFLIDYQLSARSGLDLVRAAIEAGCTRPMFLLTGQGDYEIDRMASESGASGYLEKATLDSVTLERSIRYGLQPKGQTAPVPVFTPKPGDLQLQIAIARGATVRDAAKTAGVAERTAHRRLNDPAFLAEVDRLRTELRSRIVDQVASELLDAQFGDQDNRG